MLGGGTISGATPLELAGALRASSMTPMDSMEAFMEDVAARCAVYDHDARVRHGTPEEFVEDLLRHGFLTVEGPGNVIPFPGAGAERAALLSLRLDLDSDLMGVLCPGLRHAERRWTETADCESAPRVQCCPWRDQRPVTGMRFGRPPGLLPALIWTLA